MLQHIRKYIERNNLIESLNDKIVIGLSGGADSVALLHILVQLGYRCIAAHCNFHLRNEESNRDFLFVRELCENSNITLYSIDFDTKQYASNNSLSIEMAARELRYNWFEEIRKKENATYIAVAHHSDDSVETILMNLIRGTGIRGLTGISVKNERIIRPLLCLSRQDILSYLNSNNICYINDSTNLEDIYTRNRIRLKILPLLESINPSVRSSILDTASHLSQVETVYNSNIEISIKNIFDGEKIDIKRLYQEIEPKAILFELLYKYHFNSNVINQIYNSLNYQSGKVFYSKTHKLIKDRDHLLLNEICDENNIDQYLVYERGIQSPIELKIEVVSTEKVQLTKDTNTLYIDSDKIKFPLILRKWERGDWFIPFGMKGRKKVSDYFSDNKFSLIEKDNAWLLCNTNNDILWIVNQRSDNRYRVTENTRQVVVIQLIE